MRRWSQAFSIIAGFLLLLSASLHYQELSLEMVYQSASYRQIARALGAAQKSKNELQKNQGPQVPLTIVLSTLTAPPIQPSDKDLSPLWEETKTQKKKINAWLKRLGEPKGFVKEVVAIKINPKMLVNGPFPQDGRLNKESRLSQTLQLQLPDGKTLTANQKFVQFHTTGPVTWVGQIVGKKDSQVFLSYNQDIWQGHIQLGRKTYDLSYGDDGIHLLRRINTKALASHDPRKFKHSAWSKKSKPGDKPPPVIGFPNDKGPTAIIRLLAGHDIAARDQAGGTLAINNQIATGVAQKNLELLNKKVNAEIQLVATAEIPYKQAKHLPEDLKRLAVIDDRHLDQAYNLRVQYRADAVSFYLGKMTQACGAAYQPNADSLRTQDLEATTYSVVARACATSKNAFAHQLQHNLGCGHKGKCSLRTNTQYLSWAFADGKPPSITNHPPQTLDVEEGTELILEAQASGDPEPTLQWYRNYQPIAGATSATYKDKEVLASEKGYYHLEATNSRGTQSSFSSSVSTYKKPSFTTQPEPLLVQAGKSGTLTVLVGGSAPLKYQWFKDGKPIGHNSPFFVVSPMNTKRTGEYWLVVTNKWGSATSEKVLVEIDSPPQILSQLPDSLSIKAGEDLKLEVKAVGAGPLKYQWHRNGSPLDNQTEAQLSVSVADKETNGSYRVTVSNHHGSIDSLATQVVVDLPSPQLSKTSVRAPASAGSTARSASEN